MLRPIRLNRYKLLFTFDFKVELTGNSIYEYIHQADHVEMASVLSPPLNLPTENMMLSKCHHDIRPRVFLHVFE